YFISLIVQNQELKCISYLSDLASRDEPQKLPPKSDIYETELFQWVNMEEFKSHSPERSIFRDIWEGNCHFEQHQGQEKVCDTQQDQPLTRTWVATQQVIRGSGISLKMAFAVYQDIDF
ncbi:hypothetical protein H8959_005707, partial [Pygathrix nigripes]